MDCEQALNLISARIDREIDPSDDALLTAHLLECALCRSSAEAWQAQDVELRRAYAGCEAAGAAVAERVVAKLRALPESDRLHAPRLRVMPKLRLPPLAWALAAAASLAGFALGLTWAYRNPQPKPDFANAAPAGDKTGEPASVPVQLAMIPEERLTPLRRE